jgi:hypothetical protein
MGNWLSLAFVRVDQLMISETEISKYREENLILKNQIEERTGKTVEQLYAERDRRVRDVIELREPDRVPFSVLIEPHTYSGIPKSAAYYDPIALKRTMRRIAVDLEPDMCEAGFPSCSAAMAELDVRNSVWPGGPKSSDYGFQFIEGEERWRQSTARDGWNPAQLRSIQSFRCYVSKILRTSPSGSSTIRQLLSNTIVWHRVGLNGSQGNPG